MKRILEENLREEADAVQAIEWDIPICTSNHIAQAADTIERLIAENARLKAEVDETREGNMNGIETNIFDECELHPNCTVEVLRNSITGEISIGWWDNDDPPGRMEAEK